MVVAGMGQNFSCATSRQENDFFSALLAGDVKTVKSLLISDPELIQTITIYDRLSPLHIAAANGQIEVLAQIHIFLSGLFVEENIDFS